MNRLRGLLRSRTFQLTAAAVLLAALYSAADWRSVGRVLLGLNGGYLAAALALFIPQTLLSAARWRVLVRPIQAISFRAALRHNLAAAALNLVVPSKLGDLGRAAFLPATTPGARLAAARRAMFEKGLDVAALGVLLAWGWCGGAAASWLAALTAAATAVGSAGLFVRTPRGRTALDFATIAWLALLLWSLHLWQIDFFLRAAGVVVASGEVLARLPLAIFAGLAPLSFCGVGTRDAALVGLFAHIAAAPPLAAAGLLTSLRYLIPGACGIPCLLSLRSGAPGGGQLLSNAAPRDELLRPGNAKTRETPPAGLPDCSALDRDPVYTDCGSDALRRDGLAEVHSLVRVSNTSGDS